MARYAGFWVRFLAFVLDNLVLIASVFIIQGVFSVLLPDIVIGERADLIFGELLAIIYFSWLESSSWQATLGKMWFDLKVTDRKGKRLTLWRAVLRYLSKYLSMALAGVGFLMIAFTKKKQGLHDMIAGTFVVRSR